MRGLQRAGRRVLQRMRGRGRRIRIRFPALRVTAFGAYEGTLRTAVLALKDGRRDVAEALGRIVAPLVERGSLLVPIPTTARRRRVRGLDGVALVARSAAEIAGARDRRGFGTAIRRCPARPLADAASRGARKIRLQSGRRRRPARLTLFDDVCTTGSTLRDCAAAVREAGGVVEDAVVVAVTKTAQPWRTPIVN